MKELISLLLSVAVSILTCVTAFAAVFLYDILNI